MLGIGDGDDGIERRRGAHRVVHEEGLRHRHRVGQPRGLDDDGIEATAPFQEVFHHPDEVAAHGAADAAVVHLVDFLVGLHEKVVVDADLTEFVDDHRIALAVVLGEDAVQQRRLAGAEIAGDHGDRDLFLCGHGEILEMRKAGRKRPARSKSVTAT